MAHHAGKTHLHPRFPTMSTLPYHECPGAASAPGQLKRERAGQIIVPFTTGSGYYLTHDTCRGPPQPGLKYSQT